MLSSSARSSNASIVKCDRERAASVALSHIRDYHLGGPKSDPTAASWPVTAVVLLTTFVLLGADTITGEDTELCWFETLAALDSMEEPIAPSLLDVLEAATDVIFSDGRNVSPGLTSASLATVQLPSRITETSALAASPLIGEALNKVPPTTAASDGVIITARGGSLPT